MDTDPFAMTTDINGKPIPRWQERLEAMYTDNVPFGEILSLVRSLLEERDIAAILGASDDAIIADFKARGGDPDEFAVIAGLVREGDQQRGEIKHLRSELAHIRFMIGGISGTSEDCDEPALRENAERALTRLRALGVTLREMRLP